MVGVAGRAVPAAAGLPGWILDWPPGDGVQGCSALCANGHAGVQRSADPALPLHDMGALPSLRPPEHLRCRLGVHGGGRMVHARALPEQVHGLARHALDDPEQEEPRADVLLAPLPPLNHRSRLGGGPAPGSRQRHRALRGFHQLLHACSDVLALPVDIFRAEEPVPAAGDDLADCTVLLLLRSFLLRALSLPPPRVLPALVARVAAVLLPAEHVVPIQIPDEMGATVHQADARWKRTCCREVGGQRASMVHQRIAQRPRGGREGREFAAGVLQGGARWPHR
mmetsp:Transcript_39471/g.89759  ORF Transcript_39471/g.89759 Transcript_39471/m.89759 type:complete len:282 (-) Transcript_39471:80-925(-)